MQKKGRVTFRIIMTILTGTAGIVLFGFILLMSQYRMNMLSLQEEMKENSSYIRDAYSLYGTSGKMVQTWSDKLHGAYFDMLKYALEKNPDLLKDKMSSREALGEICSLIGAQDILFVDRKGNVTDSYIGFFHDLKDKTYEPLFQTFDTAEMVKLPVYSFTAENRQSRMGGADPGENSVGIQITLNETGKTASDNTVQTEVEKTAPDNASQEVDSSWEETYYGKSNAFPILYSTLMDDGQTACVIVDYGKAQMMYEDLTDAWNYILKNEVIGSGGYAFVWSDKTGEILYYPDNLTFKGQDVSVLGMDMDQIRDGEFVRQKVNGQDMYLYPVYFSDQEAWIVCAVPAGELTRGRKITGLLMWLLFGVLAADLSYYAVLLLKRKKAAARGGVLPFVKQRSESSKRTKLLIFTVFSTIVIFLSSFYVQTLYLMSDWARNSTKQIKKIEEDLKQQEILVDGIRSFCVDGGEKLAKLAGWYLEDHPEEMTTQTLDILADILELGNMAITDQAGNTVIASSSYSSDAANAAKTEQNTASAGEDAAQSAVESTENSAIPGPEKHSVTIPLREEDDIITSYLSAEYYPSALAMVQLTSNLSGTLDAFQPGEGGFAFAVDADSGKITWHPDDLLSGKNALDYGLKESDLQDNLCKYIQLNNDNYYAVTGKYGNDLIFLTIRDEKLFQQRLPVSVTAALTALAILLLIGLWLYTCPNREDAAEPGSVRPEESGRTTQAGERSSGNREKTPEHRVFRILIFGAAGFAALLLLMRYFLRNAAGENVLEYVLSGNWEHGLNVFALTASLIIILEGGLVLFLFRRFMYLMVKMVSVRTETVVRMLVSLVSYVIVFFIVFRCLVFFGMDPSALLASAGIVSVVIGIGANSLVGDIIAGVFLLVEGNVQVGDMIKVGDFRGIVEDIGVRMTKIYDVDSEDIKIIPNKEVQNVVHMSAHLANLFLEYSICYEEDLERVEKLLIEELKKPDGRIPEMIGDLIYLGVRRLDDNGVVLLVKIRCHEAYRPRVTRAVNRKVYMMFRRNGIEVPFPQLTLHDGDIDTEEADGNVKTDGSFPDEMPQK